MRFALIIIVLVIILGGGAFAFLVYNGTIRLGAAKPVAAKPREIPKGATMVPWTFKTLPPNTLMTRELLSDPKTGQIVKAPVFLDSLKGAGVMAEAIDIVGRVLRHEKRPGYVFTESDFYPKGTRSGVTAAIPVGKRSVTLQAANLLGARTLKAGDRVDLLAAQAYDPSKKPVKVAAENGSALAPPPVKQATVRVLAQGGVVVTALSVEQVPVSGAGTKTKTKPIEEIEIAVDPEEVPGLMEAIAAGAEIACVAHSGQPEKPGTNERLIVVPTPPPAPEAPVAPPVMTVETVVGHKHQILVMPPTTAPSNPRPATVAAGQQQGGQQ